MTPSDPTSALALLARLYQLSIGKWLAMLLAPSSSFSILSLLCALGVAMLVLALRRRARGRPVRLGVIWRGLFPKGRWASPSARADIGFFLFNTLIYGLLFAWLAISAKAVAGVVAGGVGVAIGPPPLSGLDPTLARIIATLGLFLAYELAFWTDHFLSHRIAFFWAFHKPHHTAATLSPLTNFRLHPVEMIKFTNILALFLGVASGLLSALFGARISGFSIGDRNAVLLVFTLLVLHLQHSHLWIAATGAWGRILLSPAHHQIHHSMDLAHFNKNFGSYLSIWDWMFGTLCLPTRERPRLTFGVSPAGPAQHSLTGCLITPFVEAFAPLTRRIARLAPRQHGARSPRPLEAAARTNSRAQS